MEGSKIYEESYEELKNLANFIAHTDSITIDFKKLDTESAGAIRTAILDVVNDRLPDVLVVIQNSSLK